MEQEVYIFGNITCVTFKFLINRGVPESTVYKNTSPKKKEKNNSKNKDDNFYRWVVRRHPDNNRMKLINYESIPLKVIEKFNLPSISELKIIAREIAIKIQNTNQIKVNKHIKTIFDLEYHNWQEIKDIYKNRFIAPDKIEKYCKTHMLFLKSIELKDLGFKLIDIFNAYSNYTDLVFESQNFKSFCTKLRDVKNSGSIDDVLIHGLIKKPSNNHKVMTEDVIIEIKRLFADPKKYNIGDITEKVNDYLTRLNRRKISRSSVEKVVSQPYIKNECMISRFGEKYTEDHLLPYAHFDMPEKEGILWLIDGTRFQFAYKTEKDRYNFLTYFVIMDGHSKKIIGYSQDISENSIMVLSGLEMACQSTNYLPRELISDNSPAYRHKRIVKVISKAKEWGVNWRMTSNPRDNAYVERFFGVFQESFCKQYDGYLGDGMTSRNPDGKPAPELIKKFYSGKNLYTKSDLIELINQLISDYNNSLKRKALMAKDELEIQKFKRKQIEPIPLNTIKYSQLFWNLIETTIGRSTITFWNNNLKYEYNLYNQEDIYKYNGQKVLIRYPEGDFSKIMVFSLKNDEYIFSLNLYSNIPKANIERSQEQNNLIKDHSNKRRELKRSLKERIKSIEDASDKNRELLPPKITEFNRVSKIQKEETEESIMNSNLEDIVGIEKLDLFKTEEEVNFEELFKNIYSENKN